jgi:hypothetical protein
MDLTRPAVELHIERLVLSGFAPGDGPVIGAAFQRELARLLAGGGGIAPLGSGSRIERVDAGAVALLPGSSPHVAGREIASAVYGGLSR